MFDLPDNPEKEGKNPEHETPKKSILKKLPIKAQFAPTYDSKQAVKVKIPEYKKPKFELRRVFDMQHLKPNLMPDQSDHVSNNIDWSDAGTLEKICDRILRLLEHDYDAILEVTRGKFGINCLRALSILIGEKKEDQDVTQAHNDDDCSSDESDANHSVSSMDSDQYSDDDDDDDASVMSFADDMSQSSAGASSNQSSVFDSGMQIKPMPENMKEMARLLLPGLLIVVMKNNGLDTKLITTDWA